MRFVLFAAVITLFASACLADAVDPVAMTNAAIGGGELNAYTPGVEGGVGLNNIGLLITTWGKVTFVDSTNKFFYIDDGHGLQDGSGHKGIRCSYDNLATGVTITPPPDPAITPTYVSVTGVVSTVMISDKVQPNLRPRRQSDIVPRS